MVLPGYRPGFGSVKQRVASKVARGTLFHPQLPGYRPGLPKPAAAVPTAPVSGGAPVASSTAPVTDPPVPNVKDATYLAGIADDIRQRNYAKGQLAAKYTNDTAGSTVGANKQGLLHSSTLANKLADLKTGYTNDLGNLYSQFGNPDDPNDTGTAGAALLGQAQQRHAGDPSPTVVDNQTLASLNQPVNAASPNSSVQLASGWRILYDASGKPIRFLKPGETFNGQ